MPEEDKPTDWFEPLYRDAAPDGEGVPWANMGTHPGFQTWLKRHDLDGDGRSALVVGCGMGDDAIELEHDGFDVTAFDVSESAISHCRRRFPDSRVDFQVADLFADHPGWSRRFDFVLEIYTIQALPPKYEADVIARIADFVASNGSLVVVAIVGDEPRSFDDGPPWILTPGHVDALTAHGLTVSERIVDEGASKHGHDLWITTFERPAT